MGHGGGSGPPPRVSIPHPPRMSQFYHAVVSSEAEAMDTALQHLGGSSAARVGKAAVYVRVAPTDAGGNPSPPTADSVVGVDGPHVVVRDPREPTEAPTSQSYRCEPPPPPPRTRPIQHSVALESSALTLTLHLIRSVRLAIDCGARRFKVSGSFDHTIGQPGVHAHIGPASLQWLCATVACRSNINMPIRTSPFRLLI